LLIRYIYKKINTLGTVLEKLKRTIIINMIRSTGPSTVTK